MSPPMKTLRPIPLATRLAPPRVCPYLAALALATGLSVAPRAGAVVTFQFNYSDAANVGFNDPAHPEYKASLEAAGRITGSYFAHTATVVMTVKSTNEAGSAKLADAGSELTSGEAGFFPTVVQQKVISNGATDANGAADDGTVNVNLASSFQYDADSPTAVGKIDFRATMIHELTHALGFVSQFEQQPDTSKAAAYSVFDSFLTDATGGPLINKQTFVFDPAKVSTITGGNNTLMDNPGPGGEYFSGPTAIARYDNKRVPIFSPNPYQGGSSGSHVDDNTRSTKLLLMAAAVEAATTSMGMNMPRTYGAPEEGILKDLGYTLASDHATFFTNEVALQNKVYFLTLPNGNNFGYYSYLADPRYVYHFDMGYEYWFEANDGKSGVYLYDFKSGHFFYTSPSFSFPYVYDFTLGTVLYYYPDPANPQRYNTNGVRYFYNFKTGAIFTQ